MSLEEQLNNVVWYSPIGSSMTFTADGATGNLIGTYNTKPGGMSAPLIGKFNPNGPGAFGWTVSWPSSPKYPSTSATSWVANITNINGVVTIESSWMIREQLAGNSYYSTVSGTEDYTTTKSDDKTIEANKHKRAPHPL